MDEDGSKQDTSKKEVSRTPSDSPSPGDQSDGKGDFIKINQVVDEANATTSAFWTHLTLIKSNN